MCQFTNIFLSVQNWHPLITTFDHNGLCTTEDVFSGIGERKWDSLMPTFDYCNFENKVIQNRSMMHWFTLQHEEDLLGHKDS